MNILFEYWYRDGANTKNINEAAFSNKPSIDLAEVQKIIADNLIDHEFFDAKAWGVPEMFFTEYAYNPEIDITWHTFREISETSDAQVPVTCTIDEFLQRVKATKKYE